MSNAKPNRKQILQKSIMRLYEFLWIHQQFTKMKIGSKLNNL